MYTGSSKVGLAIGSFFLIFFFSLMFASISVVIAVIALISLAVLINLNLCLLMDHRVRAVVWINGAWCLKLNQGLESVIILPSTVISRPVVILHCQTVEAKSVCVLLLNTPRLSHDMRRLRCLLHSTDR